MTEQTNINRQHLFPFPDKLRPLFTFLFRVGYQGDDKLIASRSLLLTVTLFLLMTHMTSGLFVQTGIIFRALSITAPILIISYLLARTRHFLIGAWLSHFLFLGTLIVFIIMDEFTLFDITISTVYLIVSTLFMSHLLSFRIFLILMSIEFIVLTMISGFFSEHGISQLSAWLPLSMIMVIFFIVLTRILKKYEKDILMYQTHLEQLISQKDDLLKEVYHRTKNNMQSISSLLNLQMQQTTSSETMDAFKVTQDRIRSMSLVHKKLYQSKELDALNLIEYLKDLSQELVASYAYKKDQIDLRIEGYSAHMNLDRIIPVGMVINELLTNALKYAFPEGEAGSITLLLSEGKDGRIIITITDNGKGFPTDFDPRAGDSLGFKLVYNLVELQLDGEIKILPVEKGTSISIEFSPT